MMAEMKGALRAVRLAVRLAGKWDVPTDMTQVDRMAAC